MASAGYDQASGVLEVEFANGSTYQYFDVPEQVASGLLTASSVGGYLASEIKGVFRYARV